MAQALAAVQDELVGNSGKYLTFTLKDEDFGISILRVKEIIGMMGITPVPRVPEFVKGVINLRGKVIPVVDLRLKFGLPEAEYDERTCIIVVEVSADNSMTHMGIIVDAVNDVANIKSEEVEEAPSFGVSLDTTFIQGLAKTDDGVKILLDIDKVLSPQEAALLSADF